MLSANDDGAVCRGRPLMVDLPRTLRKQLSKRAGRREGGWAGARGQGRVRDLLLTLFLRLLFSLSCVKVARPQQEGHELLTNGDDGAAPLLKSGKKYYFPPETSFDK